MEKQPVSLDQSVALLEQALGEMAELVSGSLHWAKEYLAEGGKLTYRDNTRMLQTLLANVGPLALVVERLKESGDSRPMVPQIEGITLLLEQARTEIQRRESDGETHDA